MDLRHVSTLLQKTREDADVYSKQDETQPLLRKALGIAICRCDRAFKLVQKCIDSKCIKKAHNVKIPVDALKVAAEVSKKMDNEEKVDEDKTKAATRKFNKTAKTLSNFVCEEHGWLSDEFDDYVHENLHVDFHEQPETKLWWLGTFGNVKRVQWNDFWKGFSEYMDTVYGFPLGDCEFKTEMENGMKTCLQKFVLKKDVNQISWQQKGDTAVSTRDFQKFYQRFGSWETLYTKSLTLIRCHDGRPDEIFYPTVIRKEGVNFLETQGKTRGANTRKFVIRYSGKMAGALVYQSLVDDPKGLNILISNTPTGYSVETDNGSFTNMRDVPAALKIGWQMEFEDDESSAKVWRAQLKNLGTSAPAYGVLGGDNEDEHFVFVEDSSDGDRPQKNGGDNVSGYALAPDIKSPEEHEDNDGPLIGNTPIDYRDLRENAHCDESADENKYADKGDENIPAGSVHDEAVAAENKENPAPDEDKPVLEEDKHVLEENKPVPEDKPAPVEDKPVVEHEEIQEAKDDGKNQQEQFDLILTVKGLKVDGLKRVKTFVQIIPYTAAGNPLGTKQTANVKAAAAGEESSFAEISLWEPKCLIDFVEFTVWEHFTFGANKQLCKCQLPVKDNFVSNGVVKFNDSVTLTDNDGKPAGKLTVSVQCCKR